MLSRFARLGAGVAVYEISHLLWQLAMRRVGESNSWSWKGRVISALQVLRSWLRKSQMVRVLVPVHSVVVSHPGADFCPDEGEGGLRPQKVTIARVDRGSCWLYSQHIAESQCQESRLPVLGLDGTEEVPQVMAHVCLGSSDELTMLFWDCGGHYRLDVVLRRVAELGLEGDLPMRPRWKAYNNTSLCLYGVEPPLLVSGEAGLDCFGQVIQGEASLTLISLMALEITM